MGIIYKIRGSGTFVNRPAGTPRMVEASRLVQKLFSAPEPQSGTNPSKMYWEARCALARECPRPTVKTALVGRFPEEAADLTRCFSEAEVFLLEDLLARRVFLGSEFDLLLACEDCCFSLIRYAARWGCTPNRLPCRCLTKPRRR
jgi:hypothetical protein